MPLPHHYTTTVRIAAPADVVWAVLTDAGAYGDWNPEIVGIRGRFAHNERITARVRIGSGAVRTVGLKITAFDPPRRMEWTGGMPFGLFVGVRVLTVRDVGTSSEFQMDLSMTGPLAGMILKSVGDRQPEVDSFSAALEARARTLAARRLGDA
jgi:uncharacterized protein YndB with AHSA1/START domain